MIELNFLLLCVVCNLCSAFDCSNSIQLSLLPFIDWDCSMLQNGRRCLGSAFIASDDWDALQNYSQTCHKYVQIWQGKDYMSMSRNALCSRYELGRDSFIRLSLTDSKRNQFGDDSILFLQYFKIDMHTRLHRKSWWRLFNYDFPFRELYLENLFH